VQAPVEITLPDARKLDGILLDLSETGMEVLTAETQSSGALLAFHFQLPNTTVVIEAHGQVAWANSNGQTGVHFLDVAEAAQTELKSWLQAAANVAGTGEDETVPHCKLTDLSLGGCYVETNAPFPERALVDLCLKTGEMEVHTEGMVRVAHPGHGMGVEFPSRTPEQRAQVGNLINFLRNCPSSSPELSISPRALVADLAQFEPGDQKVEEAGEELEDPLLELLRRGTALQQHDFLSELQRQRSPEEASV
jgi:c-di-GMP-binding flagellar brake protein YcgR